MTPKRGVRKLSLSLGCWDKISQSSLHLLPNLSQKLRGSRASEINYKMSTKSWVFYWLSPEYKALGKEATYL